MAKAPRDAAEVNSLRKAYIEREIRPTYEELAVEFNVPISTIKGYASSEAWVTMREAHLQNVASRSDALGLVIRAASQIDQRLVQKFSDVVFLALQKISEVLHDIDPKRSPSTRIATVNTASFAFKNLADGCKAIGVTGMPKSLADEGKEANGRWNPQMLAQLNVTIQGMQAATKVGKAAESAEASTPGVTVDFGPAKAAESVNANEPE